MAKAEPKLPVELLLHLEAEWPNRLLLERTHAIPATAADPYLITEVERGVRADLVKIAIAKNLAVFKIGRPRWYRRGALAVDRQVLSDAEPIPADPRDIPWTLDEPVLLTDTLICRFSAEAVPAMTGGAAPDNDPNRTET